MTPHDWQCEQELAAELATRDARDRDRPVKPFANWGPLTPIEQETAAYNLENGFSITTKETAAICQLLRIYGWRTDESLQMFLHRRNNHVEELAYLRREMEAVWDHVQGLSPWSESNDMRWSDEIGCGLRNIKIEMTRLKTALKEIAESDGEWGEIQELADLKTKAKNELNS